MALAPKPKKQNSNPNLPPKPDQALCRKQVTKEKRCGKPAHHILEGRVVIFDSVVPVKIPVCEQHMEKLEKGGYNSER